LLAPGALAGMRAINIYRLLANNLGASRKTWQVAASFTASPP